jgi:hypothetical protein
VYRGIWGDAGQCDWGETTPWDFMSPAVGAWSIHIFITFGRDDGGHMRGREFAQSLSDHGEDEREARVGDERVDREASTAVTSMRAECGGPGAGDSAGPGAYSSSSAVDADVDRPAAAAMISVSKPCRAEARR